MCIWWHFLHIHDIDIVIVDPCLTFSSPCLRCFQGWFAKTCKGRKTNPKPCLPLQCIFSLSVLLGICCLQVSCGLKAIWVAIWVQQMLSRKLISIIWHKDIFWLAEVLPILEGCSDDRRILHNKHMLWAIGLASRIMVQVTCKWYFLCLTAQQYAN